MKAVIMAGGNGKRLRPLTSTTPKPMVRVFSKPLIAYIFDLLKSNSFDDVTVTLGYMAEQIEDYIFNDYSGKLKITAVKEAQPLGTAGSVKNAAREFFEPFLVISGDCICDFDLEKIMKYHNEQGADITIVCTKVNDPREYGVVESEECGKVKAFTEKPQWSGVACDCINTGIYIVNPKMLDYIPDNTQFDFSKDLFPAAMKDGRKICSYIADGYWCDIGNIGAYKTCINDIMDGKVNISVSQIAQGIFAEGKLPAGQYSIVPPCFVGSDVEIGDGSVIGPYSSIDNGCLVGSQCKIKGTHMLPFSVVHNNSSVNDALLCENAVVKDRVRIFEQSVIGASSTINSHCVIGSGVNIWPEKTVESGSNISRNIKYSETVKNIFSDDGISGMMGADFDSVNASIIGQAIASSAVGKKTGIATDGGVLSKSAAHSLMGALMAHGSHVWDFGESFYSQFEFFVLFCGLKSGIFISEKNESVTIRICGEGGLPLSNNIQRDIENRIKYREFSRCTQNDCKDISDMTGVGLMYRRELIRQSETELSDLSCLIKCSNEKISMLLEDCLYRLGCRQGDEITFKINNDGTSLSAFHRDCGWISADKLAAICCNYETANGKDVAVAFNAPRAFDEIAENNGQKTLRYYVAASDSSDSEARTLSGREIYMRDALFMAVKLLGIMSQTGKSLKRLADELPEFYVSRKKLNITFSPGTLYKRCEGEKYEITKEGMLLEYPQGRVLVTPSRSGRVLNMVSEAQSYEFSKDLCAHVEALMMDK